MACAASGHGCSASRYVWSTSWSVLLWKCLVYINLCCLWTCLVYTSLCFLWMSLVYTSLCCLWTWLIYALDVSGLQPVCAAPGRFRRLVLSLDMSGMQQFVPHLEEYVHSSLCCSCKCLYTAAYSAPMACLSIAGSWRQTHLVAAQ